MRFRLWHLFIAITIVAIGMFSIDQYAYDTVAVEFLSATALHTPTTLALIPKDADYAVEFTIQNTPYSIDGMAFGSFGNSQLFAAELTKSNISQFKGRTVMIRSVVGHSLGCRRPRFPTNWTSISPPSCIFRMLRNGEKIMFDAKHIDNNRGITKRCTRSRTCVCC